MTTNKNPRDMVQNNPGQFLRSSQWVKEFNAWRDSHPDEIPNLDDLLVGDTHFYEANLKGIDLTRVIGIERASGLEFAELTGAKLSDEQLASLLNRPEGKKVFNRYREQNPEVEIDASKLVSSRRGFGPPDFGFNDVNIAGINFFKCLRPMDTKSFCTKTIGFPDITLNNYQLASMFRRETDPEIITALREYIERHPQQALDSDGMKKAMGSIFHDGDFTLPMIKLGAELNDNQYKQFFFSKEGELFKEYRNRHPDQLLDLTDMSDYKFITNDEIPWDRLGNNLANVALNSWQEEYLKREKPELHDQYLEGNETALKTGLAIRHLEAGNFPEYNALIPDDAGAEAHAKKQPFQERDLSLGSFSHGELLASQNSSRAAEYAATGNPWLRRVREEAEAAKEAGKGEAPKR